MSSTLENEQTDDRQPVSYPTDTHLLVSGAPAYKLSDEDRRKSIEARKAKAEAAKAAKLEALLPKAWRMFERALSAEDVDARGLDAAKFVWEQEHGRATQRVETSQAEPTLPWAGLTPEQRKQLLREATAELEKRKAAGETSG